MAIKKEHIHDLIEIFYPAPFKIFFVNSQDGKTFTKPNGVFVSLGITSPYSVIDHIKECLQCVEGGKYSAKIIELKSSMVVGQYLNFINCENPEKQYTAEYPEVYWTADTIGSELAKYTEDSEEYKQLSKIIEKFNSESTSGDAIYFTKGEYRIFHSTVNYHRDGDVEYRIGIYVEENS